MIGVATIFLFGLTACNKPGPTETAEKKMDDAATQMDTQSKKGEVTEEASTGGDAAMVTEGEAGGETAMTTEGESDPDAAITSQVEAAILAEPSLNSLQIGVKTMNGEVTLSGTVKMQQDIDKAEEIASSVAQVNKVNNQLMLESTN